MVEKLDRLQQEKDDLCWKGRNRILGVCCQRLKGHLCRNFSPPFYSRSYV